MSPSFKFSFHDMVKWYDDAKDDASLFENDQKTVAFFIENVKKYEQVSQKQIKKRGLKDIGPKNGHKCQFIKQHITPGNIRRVKFIDQSPFELGVYYVKQDDHNVFFVTPIKKKVMFSEDVFISGDHFSFPYFPKKEEIHLHLTTYTPIPTDVNVGQITHYPRNVFADNIMMPRSGFDTDIFDDMGGSKNYVLDMCRAHVVNSVNVRQHGGGKVGKKSNACTLGVSKDLEQLLVRLKVEKIIAFGFKTAENRWHVMVDVVYKNKKSNTNDFSFTLNTPHYGAFQNKLIHELHELHDLHKIH